MITYKQQFDKLTEAYISGKVDPLNSCACFVGNLLNGDYKWGIGRGVFGEVSNADIIKESIEREAEGFYTPQEIVDLEEKFLRSINTARDNPSAYSNCSKIHLKVIKGMPLDAAEEEALFIGFEKTLDLLKQIHESKGEVVDAPPVFFKRKLTANV